MTTIEIIPPHIVTQAEFDREVEAATRAHRLRTLDMEHIVLTGGGVIGLTEEFDYESVKVFLKQNTELFDEAISLRSASVELNHAA